MQQTIPPFEREVLATNRCTIFHYMKAKNSSLSLQLCGLVKLHSDGAAAITESIGYTSSNLMSVIAGRRRIPDDVVVRLCEALSYSEDGFTNSGNIESWLARKVEDVLYLLEVGFDLRVMCRIATHRESNNPEAVLYKYALLRVMYAGTYRDVVLRMTRDGIDKLLSHPRLGRSHLLQQKQPDNLPWFGKDLDFGKLKQLHVSPPNGVSLTPHRVGSKEVLGLVSFIHDSVKADEKPSASGTSLALALATEKVKRHRAYADAIKAAYNLRGSRQPHAAHGSSNDGAPLSVEIHPIFVGETHERVEPAKTANDHLIVVQEHTNGVIEVIFEGPRQVVYPASPATENQSKPKLKPRIITVAEFRLLNATVKHSDRLLITPVNAEK